MLGLLARLLFVIAMLYFVGRVLRAVLGGVSGVARPKNSKTVSTMVRDPICGMYLDARLAVRVDGERQELYFCSKECREKYLAAPGRR